MTPDAHFYGSQAHCMLIEHNRIQGDAGTVAVDSARQGARNLRKRTVMLCRSDGGPLPELSEQLYLTTTRINVPVTLETYKNFQAAQWVALFPDARRCDPDGPSSAMVYSECDIGFDDDRVVRMCAERTIRNHQQSADIHIKYGIRGVLLQQKIIRPLRSLAAL